MSAAPMGRRLAAALALALAGTAASLVVSPAHTEVSHWTTESEGVAIKIYRNADKAVLCLSARTPVQMSGEYGVHVSWRKTSAPTEKPASVIDFATEDEHFPSPLRLDVPIPKAAPVIGLDLGACVDNDRCAPIDIKFDVGKLPAQDQSIDCTP
jgi:hypothetical protein